MIELLAVLSNRDNFNRFMPFIKDHTVPRETSLVLKGFDEYFTNNPTISDIPMDKFALWFLVLKHGTLKAEQSDIYREIFKNVDATITAPKSKSIEEIVEVFVERDFATRIADTALKVAEGDHSTTIMECEDLLREYQSESKRVSEDESLVTTDFSTLYTPMSGGLNWRLDALNKSLGPLRLGDFIVVGKLPESGGTAFAISEMSHMLTQLKPNQKILYFGNEERGQAVRKRVISSILNRNSKYVESNAVACAKEFADANGDSIEIHGMHGKGIQAIEKIIRETDEPALIVIDQLWKVVSYDRGASDVARITNLFVKARELASKYAPVIAIHQADGTAYGSVYVEMGQLYMSRIGIQGEADGIITLGVSDEAGYEKTRFINVCKNKLEGGALSEERFRHSKWEVKILTEVSRYAD